MPSESGPNNAHINAQTSMAPAIKAWEIYLHDQGRSLYTVKAFTGDLNLLASFLPPDRSIGAITTNDLNHFLNWLQNGRGVPCSPKSLARRITSIKAFFRWLHKNAAILVDPAEKVLQQSVISPLPQVLTTEEEQAVVEAAMSKRSAKKADARPYTLLTLLLTTGIKKGECLAIAKNHIDLDAPGGPILFIRYPNPNSRYKERKISLPGDWVHSYQEYVEQYQPVDKVFAWSPRRLEYLLEDIGQDAGLSKHLSFDMCRWTCALNDWRSDLDRDTIRQKLGISKIQWREISLKLRQLAGEPVETDSQA
ncbi:MAG: site-specific integrase [Chloroflexi bacterium]|jgi:site-specific recombinase XerD|nr:site-specific integrase [Anaerolineaceae bacterium]NMB87431.1 site-specific integrase [Chloroflexota bacterium]